MYDYQDLGLHECDDFFVIHGVVTTCDGDSKTADEVDE